MKINLKKSGKLNKDTELHENHTYFKTTTEAQSFIAKAQSCRERVIKRICYREVWKMWKTRMQMHQRRFTWPKILFISQLSRSTTRDDLHPSVKSKRGEKFSRKLSKYKTNNRRNKRYKPRTSQEAGAILDKDGICPPPRPHEIYRSRGILHSSCQYGRKFFGLKKGGLN